MRRKLRGIALAANLLLAVNGASSADTDPAAATAAQSPTPAATTPAAPANETEAASYNLGLLLGSQLTTNGLASKVSRAALLRGINAGLSGKIPSPEQKGSAQQFIHTSRAALADRNAEQAKRFLEKNARASGIKTLPSGLQYRVLAAGNPTAPLPGPRDQVTLRYRASLADGTELDRSDEHMQPATFRVDSVIPGWHEALSAMRPGAKWQVFVPPDLGYGLNAPPPIPPGSLIVYELELLKVDPAANPLAPGAQMHPKPERPGSPKTQATPDAAAPKQP